MAVTSRNRNSSIVKSANRQNFRDFCGGSTQHEGPATSSQLTMFNNVRWAERAKLLISRELPKDLRSGRDEGAKPHVATQQQNIDAMAA